MCRSLLIAFLLFGSVSVADEVPTERDVVIPLADIFALGMPGTGDLDALLKASAEERGKQPFLAERLARTLTAQPPGPMQALVVSGTPELATARALTAFRKADALFKKRATVLGTEVQLVFYRFVSNYEVEIVSATRRGSEVLVEYRFAPSLQPQATVDFALIPLGDLPAGKYFAKFHQLPMEQAHLDGGFAPVEADVAAALVPSDTTFEVFDLTDPTSGLPPADARIPLDTIWTLHGGNGTKGLRELEPELTIWRNTPESLAKYKDYSAKEMQQLADELRKKSIVYPLEQALRGLRLIDGGLARQGFAVRGDVRDVVRQATEVLCDKKQPDDSFAANDEVSLVVFSSHAQMGLGVTKIERRGNEFCVEYAKTPRNVATTSATLAIVPCGKLPPGEYSVVLRVKGKLEPQYQSGENLEGVLPHPFNLCHPFRFTVRE
jgi:hypothetical protein